MDQDFGRDVISITNEEGEEFELEVNILKTATDEHGEPILVVVDDNEELETVYDLLMENLYDEDEDDADEDADSED